MILQSSKLSSYPQFRHGFTTREIGADYSLLAAKLGCNTGDIIVVKQIHSALVSVHPQKMIADSDAIVTSAPHAVVGVRTADCVPILVIDPQSKSCAAIHAGWRGLVSGVIEKTLVSLRDEFGSKPPYLLASIGPALCQDCFEIGEEVARNFVARFGSEAHLRAGKESKSHADLKRLSASVLQEQGIPAESIDNLPYCTRCSPDLLYSYRRGDTEGRQVAFVGLSPL